MNVIPSILVVPMLKPIVGLYRPDMACPRISLVRVVLPTAGEPMTEILADRWFG